MTTMTLTENKKIKIFLDTNVIIDGLILRDNDYQASRDLIRQIISGKYIGYICSKQITDIHYIFRKYVKSNEDVMRYIDNITKFFEILPLLKGDILACLKTKNDFEDEILCEVAKVNMIPCLITNNIADYQKSWPIIVMTPEQFIKLNQ